MIPILVSCKSFIKSTTVKGNCVTVIKTLNTAAPTTMRYKAPTVFIVSQTEFFNISNVSWRLKKIKINTSITPTAALSVAVKKPK